MKLRNLILILAFLGLWVGATIGIEQTRADTWKATETTVTVTDVLDIDGDESYVTVNDQTEIYIFANSVARGQQVTIFCHPTERPQVCAETRETVPGLPTSGIHMAPVTIWAGLVAAFLTLLALFLVWILIMLATKKRAIAPRE